MMIKSHLMASQTRNWILFVSVWTPVYLLLFISPLNSVSSNLLPPFYNTDLQNDTEDIMLDRLNNNTIPYQSDLNTSSSSSSSQVSQSVSSFLDPYKEMAEHLAAIRDKDDDRELWQQLHQLQWYTEFEKVRISVSRSLWSVWRSGMVKWSGGQCWQQWKSRLGLLFHRASRGREWTIKSTSRTVSTFSRTIPTVSSTPRTVSTRTISASRTVSADNAIVTD